MNLLLDSHVLLWALHDPRRLSPGARAAVTDPANPVFYSPASVWELVIKSAKGQLELDADIVAAANEARFTELPIRSSHAWAVRGLPTLHGDPFDRILIAQAITERLTLVSRDGVFASYGVALLKA